MVTQMMSMLYQSYRLPPNSKCTRVIDILPIPTSASNPDDEPIESKLRIINLDDRPKFTALSYVHGTYAPTPHFIICDNIQVNITSNGHSALRHLRKKLGKLTIWLDAVCINQDDPEEKSQQIPLMGDIYSIAESVYLWLGDGSAETDRAMAYMANAGFQRYYKITPEGKLRCRPYAAALSISYAIFNWTKHPVPFGGSSAPRFGGQYTNSKDLGELLSKDWITRLWTYQEILLASNPIVVCGDWHVPWSSFERSVFFLENTSLRLYSTSFFNPKDMTRSWTSLALSRERLQTSILSFPGSEASALEKYAIFIRKISRAYWRLILARLVFGTTVIFLLLSLGVVLSEPLTIIPIMICVPVMYVFRSGVVFARFPTRKEHFTKEDLVFGLYSRTATNPKDMAFGMWAVLKRGGAVNLPAPNYSHDTGDVYRILAVHMAQMTRSLDLLLLAAARGVPGQPTWVPDWSAHKKQEWGQNLLELPQTDEHGNNLNNLDKEIRFFGIIKPRVKPTAYFEVDETKTILTVLARHVYNISMCFQFQRTSDDFRESEREIHIENLRLMLVCKSWKRVPLSRGILWKFKSLFLHNLQYILGIDPKSALSGENPQHIQSWISFWRRNHENDPSRILSLLRNNQDVLSIQISLCNLMARNEIIRFSARRPEKRGGPIVGRCSRMVQVGDQIVRFEGVSQLLIVRAHHEAGRSVKIISPAEVLTIQEGPKNQSRIGDGPWELKEQYVKYQIY